MIHWVWLILAIFLAANIGFFVAAFMTAGKVADITAKMNRLAERIRRIERATIWRP